jgi:hypothetical protein
MTVRTARQTGLLAALAPLCAVGAAGCVERKFVIESNVPNAQVYVDNRSVGAAPAYVPFDYYGHYTITVIHPGYEMVVRREHAAAPWYAYPPFDLLADIVPFPIRDTKRVYVELTEKPQVRTDELLERADALRARGLTLPVPENPAEPRNRGAPPRPTGPFLQPLVDPTTGGPPPGVSGPPVPGAVPGSIPAPVPGPAPGVVPSVTPGYPPAYNQTYIK